MAIKKQVKRHIVAMDKLLQRILGQDSTQYPIIEVGNADSIKEVQTIFFRIYSSETTKRPPLILRAYLKARRLGLRLVRGSK